MSSESSRAPASSREGSLASFPHRVAKKHFRTAAEGSQDNGNASSQNGPRAQSRGPFGTACSCFDSASSSKQQGSIQLTSKEHPRKNRASYWLPVSGTGTSSRGNLNSTLEGPETATCSPSLHSWPQEWPATHLQANCQLCGPPAICQKTNTPETTAASRKNPHSCAC